MDKIPENDEITFDKDNISTEDIWAEKMLEIINIFHIYFKILFKKERNVNMFDGINLEDESSTNRSMELLYEHIYKYKEYTKSNKLEFTELYNEDDEDVMNLNSDDLYALLIENNIEKLSPSLFAITSYLANLEQYWREINWKIINLKEN